MGTFRVHVEADFTVPKKQNAEATQTTVKKMIKRSGFEEKDFVISIDKTELVQNSTPVPAKVVKMKEPRNSRIKRVIKKEKKPKVICRKVSKVREGGAKRNQKK
jgi:hypothetical protein